MTERPEAWMCGLLSAQSAPRPRYFAAWLSCCMFEVPYRESTGGRSNKFALLQDERNSLGPRAINAARDSGRDIFTIRSST